MRNYKKPLKACEGCKFLLVNKDGDTLEEIKYCKIFVKFITNCDRKLEKKDK